MKRVAMDRNGVLAAIQKAAKRLGRPPSWSELRSISGVPESRVRAYFPTLASAVQAAGLEPNRAGLRIRDEALLQDFARVAAKLGRSPSRNEYVREGKYSAGAFYARFGSWKKISQQAHHGDTETRRNAKSGDPVITRSGDLNCKGLAEVAVRHEESPTDLTAHSTEEQGGEDHSPQINTDEHGSGKSDLRDSIRHESDKAIAMQWAGAVTAIPGELAGKRRVTDAVCAMIVNTLLGGDWYGQLSRHLGPGKQNLTADERGFTRMEESTQQSAISTQSPQSAQNRRGPGTSAIENAENYSSVAEMATVNDRGSAALARVNGDITSGGILDDGRPVIGPPFHWCALSNAPVNELGVVLLFGMLAGELGFQIEAVWGRYPDIEAKRQIRPGKWQRVRIEVEYESRNFAQHGHDPEKCDVIVCWKHNWANCPKHIEVIELSKVVSERLIG